MNIKQPIPLGRYPRPAVRLARPLCVLACVSVRARYRVGICSLDTCNEMRVGGEAPYSMEQGTPGGACKWDCENTRRSQDLFHSRTMMCQLLLGGLNGLYHLRARDAFICAEGYCDRCTPACTPRHTQFCLPMSCVCVCVRARARACACVCACAVYRGSPLSEPKGIGFDARVHARRRPEIKLARRLGNCTAPRQGEEEGDEGHEERGTKRGWRQRVGGRAQRGRQKVSTANANTAR